MNTGMTYTLDACQHCGLLHNGICPRISIIEYYPDGRVKRVEYYKLSTLPMVIEIEPAIKPPYKATC